MFAFRGISSASNNMQFQIAADVRQLGVRGAFAVLTGLDNRSYRDGFTEYREALAAKLREELASAPLTSHPVLQGFRDLHDKVSRSNRRFPSSAEALAALFERKALIPSINPLVDIYNCVSLETKLSLGAHDIAKVLGDISLRLTVGGERFIALGQTEPEAIGTGEYCYIDGSSEVLCRLEPRQCERTKVTADSTAAFYIIQGNVRTGREQIEQSLRRLVELSLRFCGGREDAFWIVD
jgi:DNA/RNA-binding domain of Phe-tRNA-synthetase-like protein